MVVYCVYGYEVGCVMVLWLWVVGCDVCFLSGGIDGWVVVGWMVVEKLCV